MEPIHGTRTRHAPLTPSVLDPGGNPCTDSGKPRTFLHVDMDAFFASVEIRDNPLLAGKPVVVGGSHGNRGVVTTASYVARKYGIHSGMPAAEARRRCPWTIFLPVNGAKYVYMSAMIMEDLKKFSPLVRPLSVDEASLDITGCERLFGSFEELGWQLKRSISRRFRLNCTVGIGPNRLIAKMASNLGKPDGLLMLTQPEARKAFAPLPVTKMVGIGSATAESLLKLGIKTLGDLANFPDNLLGESIGIVGPNLRSMARGEWAGRMRHDDGIGPSEHSMGHQRTFGETLCDLELIKCRLVGLAEMIGRRARRAQLVGNVLTVKVRYTDFQTPHHQCRLPEATDEEEILIEYGWKLLKEVWAPGTPIRLLGMSLSHLTFKESTSAQLNLFTSKRQLRNESLYRAMDELRDQFGERVITRAMSGRYCEKQHRTRRGEIVPFGHLRTGQSTVVL